MSVSYDYYKVFYYVAKFQNITTASKKLFLSQPTVSRCIQNLEESLGCKLFVRSKKGVCLTPEALILYKHVSIAQEHLEKAEEAITDRISLSDGLIRIGASEMTLHNYLLPYLERFRKTYPKIKLKISNNSTPQSINSLQSGNLDFAIVASPIKDSSNLMIKKLASFQDIVIAGEEFKHLKNTTISLQELSCYPLICMEYGTITRKFIEDFFIENGLELKPDVELATTDLITPMTEHNLGIGFVPYEFAADSLSKGKVFQIHLHENMPERYICVVTDNSHPLSMAGNAFIKMLCEKEI